MVVQKNKKCVNKACPGTLLYLNKTLVFCTGRESVKRTRLQCLTFVTKKILAMKNMLETGRDIFEFGGNSNNYSKD